ncbi:hypothetical protein RhiirC2_784438 [Rhizophagus irregularis]|uniref:RNI-like protein n=1 Tax=Rhizophagus irregularis TaxID=588596 RepID=A0A2N1MYQ3_9GLOM|nr:hypothetical protein RhiirC2_784438 [Rhizophagus irregularis]
MEKYLGFNHAQIIRTLIACLPNESKDFLINNGASIPISNPPLFNYASFCKVLSIPHLSIEDHKILTIKNPKNYLIVQEILKMFMEQIPSLKQMDFCFEKDYYDYYNYYNKLYTKYNVLDFINFPGANDLNNGRNLEELTVFHCDNNSLNLAIANYCPNLKSLNVDFPSNEKEKLIMILVNCQQLESIITSCGGSYLSGKKLLELVAKYSPKNFHELNLHNANLDSKVLESFFTSWKNRISQKPFSFIINDNGNGPLNNKKIRKLVKKYKGLGIIKKFKFSE